MRTSFPTCKIILLLKLYVNIQLSTSFFNIKMQHFRRIINLSIFFYTLSEDCMNAVSILSDTEIAVERVQKFANSSAAIPSDSDNMMQNMSQEIENLESKFADLQEIINKLDNSEIQAAYETYYSVYNSYSENASKTLGTDSNDADSFLQSTQSGSNITEQLDEAYSTLYSLIDDEVNNASTALDGQFTLSDRANIIIFAILMATGIIIILAILKIVRPLQSANGQLSKIINDISTTIEESANGTNDISSRIRNIASSVEAIKSQTAENQSIGNELKKNVEVFKNI